MNTKIVGILNITPDSFSDGGKFDSKNTALQHLQKMMLDGADVIDIGAESTRPTATPISTDEEWTRLEKILPEIVATVKKFPRKILTSIDSYHFENLKKSYELGVDIINDVKGLEDERIVNFIAEKNIATILMHNVAVPAIADAVINRNLNLTFEILNWARKKISHLAAKGVKKSQLIFDPGIGFGKDALQAIRILKNIENYRILGLPLYVGHSKKSFLEFIDVENANRAEKTLLISKYLAQKNVEFIRVHDVAENKHAISL